MNRTQILSVSLGIAFLLPFVAQAKLFDGKYDSSARLYQRSYSSKPAVTSTRGKCPKNRSLLGSLSSENLTCGKTGWIFPGLINGDCPITACVVKTRSTNGGTFGSLDF